MALSLDEKQRLATLKLPPDNEVRARLDRWAAQTGWNDSDIADQLARADGRGYSRASVNLYRLGRYPGAENPANTLALRAALTELMERNPSALERRARGQTYRTESYQKVSRAFHKALDRGWAYCIDGAPGTQKTHLLLALCDELAASEAGKNGRARRAIYVRCRPRMSRRDLLMEISLAAGIVPRGYIGQMIRKVRHHFAARRALLILDEGQQLDHAGLETMRELLDEPPYFGLLLAGSHNLKRKFFELDLEQWFSRLQNTIELAGLTEAEVEKIWTREVGPLGERKLKQLVEHCRVKDGRKGGETYLSARRLFFAIAQAQAGE